MPVPAPKKTFPLDDETFFSPVGDETRDVGGVGVPGFIRDGDDIPHAKKVTLQQFLANQTAKNAFPISADVYSEFSETTAAGQPASLSQANSGGQPTFSESQIGKYDGAGTDDGDAAGWLQSNLSKGKEGNKDFDGNNFLASIPGSPPEVTGEFAFPSEGDPAIVKNFTSRILSHNRFTPSNPIAASRDSQGRTPIMPQRKFGVYESNAPTIDPAVLSKIGSTLQLRSAGKFGADGAGYDPDSTGAEAAALIPGKTQLGIVSVTSAILEARSVLSDLEGGTGTPGGVKDRIPGTSADSFGQINTYADPFSGLLPVGMAALSVALIVAAQAALDLALGLVSSVSTASSTTSTSRDSVGRYTLGKSYANAGEEATGISIPVPARFFGVQKTRHRFSDCVSKGIEIFFGVNSSTVLTEPGFYVVFLRSIISSVRDLGSAAENSFGSGGLLGDLTGIVNFVDRIRRSRVISVLNVFAHLGDIQLTQDADNFSDPSRPSTVNDLPVGVPGVSVMKSREIELQMAWRASSSPMTMLLPASLRAAGSSKQFTGNIVSINRPYGGLNTLYAPTDANVIKIPIDMLHSIEEQLESEYVPFYFHDMRTNELIAFHAFLGSLTDSFTVNTETSDVFGRVDSIEIYKNTKRSINFSFTVVATSEDDFDVMWAKVNKLLTLVYPQWSEGLKKSRDNDSFIQPFSQVMSASPLIRLRIGDVIRSNYSRFALKRIFGYGTNSFKSETVTGNTIDSDTLAQQDTDALSLPYSGGDEFRAIQADAKSNSKPTKSAKLNPQFSYLLRPAPADGYPLAVNDDLNGRLRNTDYVRIDSLSLDKTIDSLLSTNSRITVKVTTSGASNGPTNAVANSVEPGARTFNCIVAASDLVRLKNPVTPTAKATIDSDPLDIASGHIHFDPGPNLGSGGDKNANSIVRSFETSMSQGLPCMIKSLSFNFIEFPWETAIFGSRAPKAMKIEVQVAPFHDIAPGLDAWGANRAPTYSVGQYANLYRDDQPSAESKFNENRSIIRDSRKGT